LQACNVLDNHKLAKSKTLILLTQQYQGALVRFGFENEIDTFRFDARDDHVRQSVEQAGHREVHAIGRGTVDEQEAVLEDGEAVRAGVDGHDRVGAAAVNELLGRARTGPETSVTVLLPAAMSNLSAALNSLSSSAIMDFYLRLRPQADERNRIRLSRMATFFFAIVLFGLAVFSLHKAGRVVEVGLQIASVAYGALLGVFLLGVLTRKANQRGAIVGMLFGFSVDLYLWRWTHVPWTWWVMIGTSVTFAVGWVTSVASGKGEAFSSNVREGDPPTLPKE